MGQKRKKIILDSPDNLQHELIRKHPKHSYFQTIMRQTNSQSSSDGNQKTFMLLKSSVVSNKELSKDMKQSLRDTKQLVILMNELDSKINLIFGNQNRIHRVLAKRKVDENS